MHDPAAIYARVREEGTLTLEFASEQEARDFANRICSITEQVNANIDGNNVTVEFVRIFD